MSKVNHLNLYNTICLDENHKYIWDVNPFSDYNSKLDDINKSIEENATDEFNYCNRAYIYREQAKPDRFKWKFFYNTDLLNKALTDLNKAIKLNPNEAIFYSDRGYIHWQLENFACAWQDFDKAIDLDSNDAINYSNRACTYLILGEYEDAEIDIEKAIKLNPNSSFEENKRFISSEHSKQDTSNFFISLQRNLVKNSKQIKSDPENALHYFARAVTFYKLEELKYALSDVYKAIKFAPNTKDILNKKVSDTYHLSEFYNLRGLIYQNLGKSKRAEKDYQKALSVNSTCVFPFDDDIKAKIYFNLGILHKDLKNYDCALSNFQEVIAIPEKLKERAIVSRENSRFKDATVLPERFGNIEITSEAYFQQAQIYALKEEYQSAFIAFDNAIDPPPKTWIKHNLQNKWHICVFGVSLNKRHKSFIGF